MEIREDLRYTKTHEWVRREGDEIVVGITDWAQEQLTDIVFVELPSVGTEIQAGEPFGSVEAVKAVTDIFAPASGEITAVNDALGDDPAAVNRSAYGDGWMVRAKIKKPGELDALLSGAQYAAWVAEGGGH
jgi:glycine cleavage system H protein